jgi:hypothetical protein
MCILKFSLVVMGIACLLTKQAAAQTGQKFSVQGSGLFASLFGEEYKDVGNGVGFEIQARYTPSAFSVGAGFQYTSHGSDDPSFDADFSLSGGFVEPRYVFPTQSDNVGPYVSTRFSILRESAKVEGFEGSATGFNANVGGGILLRVGPRVNLDFGATYGYTDFGEIVIRDPDGDVIDRGEGGPGSNLVLRLGVAVGLGG